MKKITIVLCSILVVIMLVFGGLFALWYKGGIEASTYFTDINTGITSSYGPQLFYRGIKIPVSGETIVLFKRYYSIVWKEPDTDLITSVSYKQEGYNQFFMFYEDEQGGIAAEGLCMVGPFGPDGQIMYDICDVKEAQCYAPDGTEVSVVKDGTGIILLYFTDGSKSREVELDNYQRTKLKIWSREGELKQDKVYENPANAK